MKCSLTAAFFLVLCSCITLSGLKEQIFTHYSVREHGHWHASSGPVVNPVKADARSLANGKSKFDTYCAMCHGADGRGDGDRAKNLPKRPTDLTKLRGTIPEYSIFLQISYGNQEMPRWMKEVSERDRWDMVNYIVSIANAKKT